MSSASKSKTKSAAVKEHVKDSLKPLVSTIGTSHRTENAVDALGRAVHGVGHSHTVEDCDTHSGSSGTGQEYDSVSNNGSYSGESEDLKEKTVTNIVDSEKRERIRHRNEKKHQRQRERRAQELHERCCSFLMSRKLESLSRQLVAMGFTLERATAALMMNDGKLEESVSWLLEGNTEVNKKDRNLAGGCSLKIDITDELARVAAMETRFNSSKKDIERAIVSSEGDIQKAEEVIRKQKQESLLSSRKSEETTCDPATPTEKYAALESIQRRKSERDLNFPNAVYIGAAHSESVIKTQQLLFREHASGISDGSLEPSVSNFTRNKFAPAASGLLRPSTSHISTGHVANNVQQTAVREPLAATKHPQSRSVKPVDLNPGRATGSYSTSIHGYESLVSYQNDQANQNLSSISARHVHPQQSHYRADHRQQDHVPNLSDTSKMQLGSYGSRNPMTPSSPTLNPPSSLGLFSSRPTSGNSSSSHVDWNHVTRCTHGEMPLCDYTSIDWTMNSTPASKSTNAQWIGLGLSSTWKNLNTKGDAVSGYSVSMMAGRDLAVGLNEWTSPFGGKDIFSAPRHCVNSSSLW